MHERNTYKGFTLIELMVVVVLLAIFATIAMPSFSSLIESNRVQSTAAEFQALLLAARTDAVTKRAEVTVGQSGTTWTATQHDAAVRRIDIPSSVSVTPNITNIVFRANGSATAAIVKFSSDKTTTTYIVTATLPGQIKNEKQ
jgi:type IV fimbrial biogenesis protein FimU